MINEYASVKKERDTGRESRKGREGRQGRGKGRGRKKEKEGRQGGRKKKAENHIDHGIGERHQPGFLCFEGRVVN